MTIQKIIKYSLLVLLLAGAASCRNEQGHNAEKGIDLDSLLKVERYVWPDSLRLVYAIPDSLRTEEEKEMIVSLQKIRFDYTEVEDNAMVFKMSFDEFMKTGLPEPYYHLLVSRTNDYNIFFAKWGGPNDTISSVWERRQQRFYEELPEKEE